MVTPELEFPLRAGLKYAEVPGTPDVSTSVFPNLSTMRQSTVSPPTCSGISLSAVRKRDTELRTRRKHWHEPTPHYTCLRSAGDETTHQYVLGGTCYLLTETSRYERVARSVGIPTKITVRPSTVAGILTFVGTEISSTEFVQLFDNPLLDRAVSAAWPDMEKLMRSGVDLSAKNLARLRFDLDDALHECLTVLERAQDAEDQAPGAETSSDERFMELIELAARRGYSLIPEVAAIRDRIGSGDKRVDELQRMLDEAMAANSELDPACLTPPSRATFSANPSARATRRTGSILSLSAPANLSINGWVSDTRSPSSSLPFGWTRTVIPSLSDERQTWILQSLPEQREERLFVFVPAEAILGMRYVEAFEVELSKKPLVHEVVRRSENRLRPILLVGTALDHSISSKEREPGILSTPFSTKSSKSPSTKTRAEIEIIEVNSPLDRVTNWIVVFVVWRGNKNRWFLICQLFAVQANNNEALTSENTVDVAQMLSNFLDRTAKRWIVEIH